MPARAGTAVRLFVPSTVYDCVTAYNTETGEELWRFYTDGPVRFAPVAADGKVYVASDDGWVYCLHASSGGVAWKFRVAPSTRRVLGNERMISVWPVRGAPVLRDGTLYVAASIWPFMGVFIYALDAETGAVEWANTGEGTRWTEQQHTTCWSFGTVAPQGYLAATADTLLVSGGRTVPAAFDRASGAFQHFNGSDRTFGRAQGGYAVGVVRDWFFCGPGARDGGRPAMYTLADGEPVLRTRATVLTQEKVYDVEWGTLRALDCGGDAPTLDVVWSLAPSVSISEVFCRAGDRLYSGGAGQVVAVDDMGDHGEEAWAASITGMPRTMLAADNKLFVATEEGCLYCFGETETGAEGPTGEAPEIAWPQEDAWTAEAETILTTTGVATGYCLAVGVGSGRLMEALARVKKRTCWASTSSASTPIPLSCGICASVGRIWAFPPNAAASSKATCSPQASRPTSRAWWSAKMPTPGKTDILPAPRKTARLRAWSKRCSAACGPTAAWRARPATWCSPRWSPPSHW